MVDDADELTRLEPAQRRRCRRRREQARYEPRARALHEYGEVLAHRVLILREEAIDGVNDLAGEVVDSEGRGARLDLLEAAVAFVCAARLL